MTAPNGDSMFCSEGPRPPFRAWRDPYGVEHPDVPRCSGSATRRGIIRPYTADCSRKGVVFAGVRYGWERWYCLQHDPAKRDEKRVAELAPTLLELVRQARDLMPRTKATLAWRERAERAIARAEGAR